MQFDLWGGAQQRIVKIVSSRFFFGSLELFANTDKQHQRQQQNLKWRKIIIVTIIGV